MGQLGPYRLTIDQTPPMSQDDELDLAALQKGLDELAQWEKKMGTIERDLEIRRIRSTHHHYQHRSLIVRKIPKFWYIVFAENDDFADYVSPDDLRYLESIENIDVTFKIATAKEPFSQDDLDHHRDFSIAFTFTSSGSVPPQVVTKPFYSQMRNGEEYITSEPVDVQWPPELELINPQRIKRENREQPLLSKLKKDYRSGMKSFFSWFAWTGQKPGKEFRNGEDVARLIVDDLYVNALKYYILALPNANSGDDEDDSDLEQDSSEGEPLDLGEDIEEEQSGGDMSKKRGLEDGDDDGTNTAGQGDAKRRQ